MVNKLKSNPEKGLRTVSIDFAGKNRQLKYVHTVIGDFENEANQVLRVQRAIEQGTMLFADRIMDGWLGNAKIFSMAIRYGLMHEATKEDPITSDIVDVAIDSYIEAGGSKKDLTRAIVTAYSYATNPSSVASLQRSWKISDDRQTFLTDLENQRMDVAEKAIAEARAKKIDGSPSKDLPS